MMDAANFFLNAAERAHAGRERRAGVDEHRLPTVPDEGGQQAEDTVFMSPQALAPSTAGPLQLSSSSAGNEDGVLRHLGNMLKLESHSGVAAERPFAEDKFSGITRKFYNVGEHVLVRQSDVSREGPDAVLTGSISRLVERVHPRRDVSQHVQKILQQDPGKRHFVFSGPAQGVYEYLGRTEDRIKGRYS